MRLTKENIDDCYAIKKGANEEYTLYYIPKSTNISEFLTEVAKDQFWFIPENEIGNFNGDNTCTDTPYRQYITAIKSKPFLLLAGISGTGKSRIVRELARSCWDKDSEEYKAQKPRNFEMIQVKPNWHDSSELFGYVSRISGNAKYIAGDFLKFITHAWENWLSNNKMPYFLCLDEMNLAPVEQYFAEYLSVVESRKLDAGTIKSDPLIKKDADGFHDLIDRQLAWKPQEVHDMYEKDGICLPPNLIVVGTVNMDETTFSFSRKVLDRAMTIEMNEVNLWGGLNDRYESIEQQSVETLIGTAVEGVDVYASHQAVCDTCLTYLQKVNKELEDTPFKVAYRTRNEVLLYVVNNLPYNQSADGTALPQEYVIARALDEITNMKILSRIEGDESKVRKDRLDRLVETIREGLESISGCQYGAESMERDDSQVEKSISIAKLEEMTKKLTDSGYTSYWS
ncbi:AAA family ATPase [uncultured Porphyromonas sp.]|uniref:McrB family protein n=1 Tax=uncultured Porphyromonas sp. TaxID=159274 RepID=UPI00260C8252|nr:AAA family ATPase [uncultured Porphyromonas sp.]